MAQQVAVLITWDVDVYSRHDPERKRAVLRAAHELCQRHGIPATFFFVAEEAKWYAEEIAAMIEAGQEIGSHGLSHGDEEEYDRMSPGMQYRYIERATRLLEQETNAPVTAFRAPRVKVSSTTLALLGELGYWTDSSVCSQRLDLVSSNLINTGWLTAPRSPYHPHRDSAFRRGDLDILEVPIAALIIPFISSALYVLRLPLFKLLFLLLYHEAKQTGKPIVYLGHPAEFGARSNPPLRWSQLSPQALRTHGFRFRKRLFVSSAESRLRLSQALLSYMRTFADVQFTTMREYATRSAGQGSGRQRNT